MPTPWGLLDLKFTCVYWLFEAFDASSEEAETAVQRVCMIFWHFEEELGDIEPPCDIF